MFMFCIWATIKHFCRFIPFHHSTGILPPLRPSAADGSAQRITRRNNNCWHKTFLFTNFISFYLSGLSSYEYFELTWNHSLAVITFTYKRQRRLQNAHSDFISLRIVELSTFNYALAEEIPLKQIPAQQSLCLESCHAVSWGWRDSRGILTNWIASLNT